MREEQNMTIILFDVDDPDGDDDNNFIKMEKMYIMKCNLIVFILKIDASTARQITMIILSTALFFPLL